MFGESFRISKKTDYKSFKKVVCEHWGVPDNKFDVYDANGEGIEISGTFNKIEKIIELGII